MSTLRLTRANQDVGSFLSVLGSLRETRLTAVLGFLVSRFPEEFGSLLGFRPSPADEISVEETDAGERYDVLIRQSGETHIIEGKIGPTQSVDQLLRYVRSVRRTRGRRPALTVVDDGSEFSQSRQRVFLPVSREVRSLRFVKWSQVAEICRGIAGKRRFAKSNQSFEKARRRANASESLRHVAAEPGKNLRMDCQWSENVAATDSGFRFPHSLARMPIAAATRPNARATMLGSGIAVTDTLPTAP
jgi:hypothetical protein